MQISHWSYLLSQIISKNFLISQTIYYLIILTIQMQVSELKVNEQGMQSKMEFIKNKLSPELVKKYKQIFDEYDKEDSMFVQVKDVPAILKILKVSVTEQQVIQLLGEKVQKLPDQSPLSSAKIDFTDFLTLIVDKDNQITMKQQLMESFRVFDVQKNGFLPVNQFRYYLRTYGIAMPEDQVQDLIKDSEPEDGYIKYEKFINNMLGLNQ